MDKWEVEAELFDSNGDIVGEAEIWRCGSCFTEVHMPWGATSE